MTIQASQISSIFEDLSHFDRFKRNVSQTASSDPTDLKVEVLDYTINLDDSQPQKRTISVPDLATLPLPPLRIMLTPYSVLKVACQLMQE